MLIIQHVHVYVGYAELISPVCNGVIKVIAIRTDCIKLPFRIEVIINDNTNNTNTNSNSNTAKGNNRQWICVMDNCYGPVVECQIEHVLGLRLVWLSTDLNMLDGLSTACAGGGIHLEVIAISVPVTI